MDKVLTEEGNSGRRRAVPRVTDADCLRDHVRRCVQSYFQHLDGHVPANLHDTVMTQCELPLIQVVLSHSNGNLSLAARMLGINRSTLRRKLHQYGLD